MRGRAAVRLLIAAPLTLALGGCAAFPTVMAGLSGLWSTISATEWLRARANAGLPPGMRSDPSQPDPDRQAPASASQAAIDDAYRQGVRDAVKQLSEGLGRDPRWTWVSPMVQEVWIPAQVTGGVFIPGHREWVMIRPGHWQSQFGLPLGPAPEIQPTGGTAARR